MNQYHNGICIRCNEEEVYSQTLTPNLCLNCYHRGEQENREIMIECEHDYAEGLI